MTKQEIQNISEKFAEAATGSCMSIQEVLCHIDQENFDDLDLDWDLIDNLTFNCVCCGWWCEAGDWSNIEEEANENVCRECEGDWQ